MSLHSHIVAGHVHKSPEWLAAYETLPHQRLSIHLLDRVIDDSARALAAEGVDPEMVTRALTRVVERALPTTLTHHERARAMAETLTFRLPADLERLIPDAVDPH